MISYFGLSSGINKLFKEKFPYKTIFIHTFSSLI